jgi:hypothetical protein
MPWTCREDSVPTNQCPKRKAQRPVSLLDRLGAREQTAVDSIDDRLSTDLTTAEEPAVETFDRVFASLDSVEFEVNIALGVWI